MPTNPTYPHPDGGWGAGGAGNAGIALLQLGAGLYDSYQNRKTSKWNTEQTIAAQKREAELAYQRSIEMWHMQNMYNDPQSQMQRFVSAGLNPHLIYGQGNSGNASSMPQYQAPNLQYKYAAPEYGQAIQSVLPTLMAVGTWMQNMRASEVQIQKQTTDTERLQQLVDYLSEKNPRALRSMDNQLSIFPYQESAARAGEAISWSKLAEIEANYQAQYGEPLFRHGMTPGQDRGAKDGGLKRIEFLRRSAELEGQGYKNKILGAQSSWTDFSVTNPQALIQLVLSGVMGMAGKSLSNVRRPSSGTSMPPKRVKTFYQNGKRRSQVVDY